MDQAKVMQAARIVARAFEREVRPDFLDEIHAYLGDPLSGLPDDAQKLANRGANQITHVLEKRENADDIAEWDDYLDASYAELFLGVAMQTIAPQESVVLGEVKVMYQKQYFEVLEVMKACDWPLPEGFHEPADHIAAEWLFYLFLKEKAIEGSPAAAEAASMFKKQHMDTWMEKAFKEMVDRDDVGFYTGIVNIARSLMIVMD